MKKHILIMLYICSSAVYAQNFSWVQSPEINMPYNGEMVGYCTTVDSQGNIYFAGYKDQPFLYSDILGTLYLNKYSPGGNLLSSNIINGHAQCYTMAADSQGNIILALGYVNTITVNGETFTTVDQAVQRLIVKLDSSGNTVWRRLLAAADMGADNYNELGDFRALAVDSQDNIYIGYSDFYKSYVEKLSPQGVLQHTIEQRGVNRISSLDIDTEGNIYAAGSCSNYNSQFGDHDIQSSFEYETYIAKYSAAGAYQWVKFVEDVTCSEPHVVVRSPDEVYFSSNLYGSFAFDGFTAEGPAQSGEDFFLVRLNAQGQFQWLREVPGDGRANPGYRNFLHIDNQGNIYFCGRTSFTTNWGDGITTAIENFNYNALILKYNPDGNILIAKTIPSESYSRIDGITSDNAGNLYVTGMGIGASTFDAIAYNPDQNDQYYAFLSKIDNEALGTQTPQTKYVAVYPNPVHDKLFINGLNQTSKGFISNTLGQKVMDITIGGTTAADVSDLPYGTYFIQIEGAKASKFIKN